ncbi:zinc-binding dehydrogenase [Catenuloplanes japonicus]|uniref:zinc-binding dehydrogenase n=1 Tax=Catenuloplanes japonicus TaxID=33876 RepID=UPI000526EB98|nr:zinc-binding dehydrogenase [Catenuloplanes japonicus]
MRAVQVAEFGGPEVLTPVTLPDPSPGPGQVVVAVEAADVIFLDTMLRRGLAPPTFPLTLPYVPGFGGAGTVTSVGDGVDASWLGRRVVARADDGGYAERFAASAETLVPVPDSVTSAQAAALMHDGVTALRYDRLGAPDRDEWVLVLAAAGGAGSLLVQLAVEAGARVVAAASSTEKRRLARSLGASVTVDYTTPDWPQTVRTAIDGGVSLVYDGAGGEFGTAARGATEDGGRIVAFGTANGFPVSDAERGIRVITPLSDGRPTPATMREFLRLALERAAEGRLRPSIGATFPLDRAADAHHSLAARTTIGKSLLLI